MRGSLGLRLKKCAVEILVWGAVLYGSEDWKHSRYGYEGDDEVLELIQEYSTHCMTYY